MDKQKVIAIDAMGGDHGIAVTIPASIDIVRKLADVRLILVGQEDVLRAGLQSCEAELRKRITIQHASQVVAMDEPVLVAMRRKKDSSLRIALNLVKEGTADACVSAGNTGVLMASARFVLKTLHGIERPAIIAALPTITGHTHMLDLGANIDSEAEHLFGFAVMGAVLVRAISNIENPSIGLLNIGEEDIKGNERVKKTARLLADTPLNYVGFIEGDDIYKGRVDIVVSDGFVGNVALKSSEGVAAMIRHYLTKEFQKNTFTRFLGMLASPVLAAFRKDMDPRKYNGASLLGLRGIVIKSHGSADIFSFSNAIQVAITEVEKDVPNLISEEVQHILS